MVNFIYGVVREGRFYSRFSSYQKPLVKCVSPHFRTHTHWLSERKIAIAVCLIAIVLSAVSLSAFNISFIVA